MQSIIQTAASVANALTVIIFGVGYYFMIRLEIENTKDMNDLVGAVERLPESLAWSDGRHESMANSGS